MVHTRVARIVACVALVAIAGCPTLAQGSKADQARAQRLYAQMQRAWEAEDWNKAAELGTEIHGLLERRSTMAYNVACAHAKAGNLDQACQWLAQAGDDGFQGASLVRTDLDLQSVRSQPCWEDSIAQITANRAAALDQFKAEHPVIPAETVLPPRHDPSEPAPLILALHSYGGAPKEQVRAWKQAAARVGAILVCPSAIRELDVHSGRFQWLFMDESEWIILSALEQAKAKHNIDPERVVITGFSQGGNMSMFVACKHPELFAGVIPMGFHYEPNVSPMPTDLEPGEMPAFAFLIGEHDEFGYTNDDAEDDVKAAGARAMLRRYPNVGHEMPPNRAKELVGAYRFVMGEDG